LQNGINQPGELATVLHKLGQFFLDGFQLVTLGANFGDEIRYNWGKSFLLIGRERIPFFMSNPGGVGPVGRSIGQLETSGRIKGFSKFVGSVPNS
jgi:hypothetical protein